MEDLAGHHIMKKWLLIATLVGVLVGILVGVLSGLVVHKSEVRTTMNWYVAVAFTLSLVLPFLPRRNHQGWAKITWVLMCLMAITWAVLGIVYDVHYATLSKTAIRYLVHYREMAGGLWIGLWIGLALSGQMFCMRAKQLQDGE